MTIKLLWLVGAGYYDLRIFAGADPDKRPFVGQLRMSPEAARAFRALVLAGDATLREHVVSEVGWEEVNW